MWFGQLKILEIIEFFKMQSLIWRRLEILLFIFHGDDLEERKKDFKQPFMIGLFNQYYM